MSSKRVEAFRRTTREALLNDRKFNDAKNYLAGASPLRKAETAAWLLDLLATDLDSVSEAEATNASKLAFHTAMLKEKISQLVTSGPAAGDKSRVVETPAPGRAPSAGPVAEKPHQVKS